jgi:predicted phosphodiesterase
MIIRFIGDIHGKTREYNALASEATCSIQLGDFGMGFPGVTNQQLKSENHGFIRGNHDNPAVCKQERNWIADGSMFNGVFCVGGADSIDKDQRTIGIDWWADEQLSYQELSKIIDIYDQIRPDYVATHDCPVEMFTWLLTALNRPKFKDFTRTSQALQTMFEIHQPKLWMYGHHHYTIQHKIGRTLFICLDELAYCDIEVGG